VVGELLGQFPGFAVQSLQEAGELLAGTLLVEAVAVEKQHLRLPFLHHLGKHLLRPDGVENFAGIADSHRGECVLFCGW
jgi:hypothetical protein